MTNPLLSPLVEDYLSLLYIQERDQEKTSPAQLAAIFQVTPPTVTATVQRLERDGWIEKETKHDIRLTLAGKQIAARVLRRRMLAEILLAYSLKMPWPGLYEEAHRIEHSLSEEITDRIAEMYADPCTCPYGNPFPGKEAVAAQWVSLPNLTPPVRGILRRVHEKAAFKPGLLTYFEKLDLIPGATVDFLDFDGINNVYHLQVNGHSADVGVSLAGWLFLELPQAAQ